MYKNQVKLNDKIWSFFNECSLEEIENFEDQLEKEGKKFRELEVDHSKSLTEVEKSHKKIKKLEMKTNRFEEKMEELQQELQAKDDLVGSIIVVVFFDIEISHLGSNFKVKH